MKTLAMFQNPKVYDSLILSRDHRPDKTILHTECGFSFNGVWRVKRHMGVWYDDSEWYVCPACEKRSNPHEQYIFHGRLSESQYCEIPFEISAVAVECKHHIDLVVCCREAIVRENTERVSRRTDKTWKVIRFDFNKSQVMFKRWTGKKRDGAKKGWLPVDPMEFILSPNGSEKTEDILYPLNFLEPKSSITEYKQEYASFLRTLRDAIVRKLETKINYKIKQIKRPIAFVDQSATPHVAYHLLRTLICKMIVPDIPYMSRDTNIPDVFNALFDIFKDKETVEQDFIQAVLKGEPFTKALLQAAKVVPRPTFIKLVDNNPAHVIGLAIAGRMTTNTDRQRRLAVLLAEGWIYRSNRSDFSDYNIRRNKDRLREFPLYLSFVGDLKKAKGEVYTDLLLDRIRTEEQFLLFYDTAATYRNLSDTNKKQLLDADVKVKELHDAAVSLLHKQNFVDAVLPVFTELQDNDFFSPSSLAELQKLGKVLKNCVFTYKRQIQQQSRAIVFMKEQSKVVACLEIKLHLKGFDFVSGEIVQAKLCANVPCYKNESVNNKILQYAKSHKLTVSPHMFDLKGGNVVGI